MRHAILAAMIVSTGAVGLARGDGPATNPTTQQSERTGRTHRSDRGDSAPAATAPTTGPTGEITAGPAKSVPAIYDPVMRRNIFVRGERTWGGDDTLTTRRTDPPPQPVEAQQVFTGILLDPNNGSAIALIENSETHQQTEVNPGGSFNGGTVSDMSLEGLTYTLNGRATRVRVGQDMKGGSVAAMSPTTNPSGGGSGKSNDEVIERLRRRREESMGAGAPKKP